MKQLFYILSLFLFYPFFSYSQISAGTYTIGGAAPNYATFTAAVTDLNTNGLVGDGPVIFNVRNGTYDEQIVLNQITNASAVNTITFQSENSDSTLVILERTVIACCSFNYIIKLDGGDFITFKQLTIRNPTTGSSRRVIELINNADNNQFLNNIISSTATTSTSNAGAVFYSAETGTGDECDNLSIKNNVINNGSHGIYFYQPTAHAQGIDIQNNIFEDQYYRIIEVEDHQKVTVIDNTLKTNSTRNDCYGLYLNDCDGQHDIQRNLIYAKTGAKMSHGIYLSGSTSTIGNNGIIANNMVHVNGSPSTSYALNLASTSEYFNIYSNTFNVGSSCTASTSYGFQTFNSTDDLQIINNIFSNYSGGTSDWAINIPNSSAVGGIDYNNYWTSTGTNFRGRFGGVTSTVFATYTGASGETNSLNIDPQYFDADNGDLRVGNGTLETAGVDLPSVTSDIYGAVRPDPPTIGAHELGTGAVNDAGAKSVDQPTVPFCVGNNDVYISIRNFGSATLTSVTVNWKVNGILQTPFNWVGSIPTLTFSAPVNIGSYNFVGQTAHSIEVWTTVPNAVADENTTNDTVTRGNMNPALSGTYVIGATGYYATVTAAVDTLEAHGVCGPVIMNIQTATYTEQVDIQEIPGASATNTITFQSLSGDSNDVVLTYALATFADNYTVKLDGADYIIFQNMTISSTDPFDNRVIEIANSATFNEFHNNKLMTIAGSNGDEIVHSESASRNDSDNVFTNNWFLNGNKGIWFEGPGAVTPRTGGLTIENNLFETFRYGIYVEYITDVTINNNRMINAATSNGPATQGILCRGCDSVLTISKNEIIMIDGTNNHGMELLDCQGSVANPGVVANNMIVAGGTGTSRCIYTNATTNKNFCFNSLLTTGTNTSSSVAYYFNGPQSVNPNLNANFIVRNNIFMATNGYAIINSVGGINASDNNDYFSSGWVGGGRGALGEWDIAAINTLAELQTASSDDVNSMSVDPLYTSTTDLHLQAASPVIGQGGPPACVADDIDGDIRGGTPGIGADEPPGVLPISLLYFSAEAINQKVLINWGTYSEINNDYFTIERSTDHEYFEEVNQLEGAGNSNIILTYNTVDEHPYTGISYYRLKQTDFDGKYEYTKAIKVNITEDGAIQLFPNPTNGLISIEMGEVKTNLTAILTNSLGQVMFTQHYESIDIIDLKINAPNGIYFLQLQTENGEVITKKIIKE